MRAIKIASALLLLLPSALTAAQGLVDLLKGTGIPEVVKAEDLPAGFKAFNIKAGASDATTSMLDLIWPSMMLSGFGGSGSDQRFEIFDYSQASWTEGQMVKTETGEFLVTYRMGLDPKLMSSNSAVPDGKLRLTLVRKDSILQITPRPDLTRARMAELFSTPTQPVATPSKKVAALSNMKQLGLAMIMYSTDYDDMMPYVQDTKSAFAVTYPYMKNRELTKSLNPSGGRVLMNMAVAGVSSTEIEDVAGTVMFYDEKPWPDGTRPVVYCDGHAKTLSQEGWLAAEKSLHVRIKRKAKPLPPNYWKQIVPDFDSGASSGAPPPDARPIK